ncbi:hypothetical protein H6P81_002983 [Aristolochia fimbriata]|uniref:Aminotransferase-like plant mobile domain-containing protein n=1 Tax=Aristolochia fimbriata TaxID=158543 RepID=A0AAV7FBB4_ARIFI|nr:hypothetical protein H6P81_002983 [Aristolochia fimbriata]
MNERLMCLHGQVLGCRKVQSYSHQVQRGLRADQCPRVSTILWIGEMTTEDDICVATVSSPVTTNGPVKPRLLTAQRVPVRGLGVGNVVMADAPLLYDQDSHRSEAIWHGEDPGCLECTEHFQTLRHWPMDERMLSYVEAAGFGALHRVQWLRLDKPLITALVERWRSETNTFHLANGEMTITLEDMGILLGLRVDGDAVTGSTRGDWMELARVLLGVELPPGSFQGVCPDDATELVIQQHARAYLLHLVGATIFSDGSARGVHMAYLTLFEDFEDAGRYSWGAATLAFLYRELAKACRTGVVGIAGCLTLMQLWAWERLHTGRSTLLEKLELQGGPLGSRYVNWQSYQDFMQRLPAICVEGRRIWLSRTPLICFEIVELHVTPPEDVEHVTRISRKGRAGEDWALYHRDYIARWEAREESVVMGSRVHTPRHAPSDYMRWYLGATRRFIAPPPTEPAMVYHPRAYTEEALLGCVRNVIERVNHRQPYTHHPQTHIGWRLDSTVSRSCTVFHSWRERTSAEMCHMLVSLLTWLSQPERELGLQLRRRLVSRTLTRFQPYQSLRCSIFHLSRHPTRSPARPLSSLSSSQRSLSPAATLPLGGFI